VRPDQKEAMKWAIPWGEFCETQTMAAVPYEEALRLLKETFPSFF